MKEAIAHRVFAFILTVFLLFVSLITAYADNPDHGMEEIASYPVQSEPSENSNRTEASAAVPTTEPIIPAKFPALTVNAISNFFPKSSSEYNANTKEITVTYWMRSTKNVLSVNWDLEYDTESLSFSLNKNPSLNICPSIAENSVMSFPEKGKISYCASSMALFDFSSQDKPFVQIVFDVININPEEPILSKVDLTVDNLIVSDINSATGYSDPKEEITVVEDSIENPAIDPIFERITKMTTLTPSNFIQATESPSQSQTEQSTDPNGSVIASETIVPQTTSATQSTTAPTQPTSPTDPSVNDDDKPDSKEQGIVGTGEPGYAWISFGVITVSALILFIMRKKEIMF